MHRVFISDLHLEDVSSNRFARFSELMRVESAKADELYLLGDIVEMWIGDDDDHELATELANVMRQASATCKVMFMQGNRDFLMGDQFAQNSAATLLPDPCSCADGLLLTHGDALCTDDTEYQNMRQVFRSSAWQQDILSKSLTERKAFGMALRAQSQQSNANKATNIMDVNEQATVALANKHSTSTLLHGHTHRPGFHSTTFGQRIVLGAWDHTGWLCRQKDNKFDLECFSLSSPYSS